MQDRSHRLGQELYRHLRELVRELAARKPGGHLIDSRLGQLTLDLWLPLSEDPAAAGRFNDRLHASIHQILDDEVERAASFRLGFLFCHRCKNAECDHAVPPSCRHVFVGYAPTGQPRWEDFAQYCLEQKHPEVDRLYTDPPALVTLVQGRHLLQGALLDVFRNSAYELLGQLIAGFYPVRARAEEGRGVLALTVQVVAMRSRRGSVRLGLNVLGRSPSGEPLEQLWERHEELPWRKSLRWAQAAVETVRVRSVRGAPPADSELETRIQGILSGLARRLDRDRRARSRRTRHAEGRHNSGQRPTRKAFDDARSASDEALLFDEQSGTLVVLGERGRTHFFTADGQLVSSVRYSRDAIQRKLKGEKWRPVEREISASFRGKLTG